MECIGVIDWALLSLRRSVRKRIFSALLDGEVAVFATDRADGVDKAFPNRSMGFTKLNPHR